MDVEHSPRPPSGSFAHSNADETWVGLRPSRDEPPAPPVLGTDSLLLFTAAGLALLVCGGGALSLMQPAPRAATQVAQDVAPAQEAPTQAPPPAPIVAGDGETLLVDAGDGIAVTPLATPRPLTVRERVTLRARPGEASAGSRGTVAPGQRLRVIGQLRTGDGDIWLQVRADDGGLAYMEASDAVFHDVWRSAQAAQRSADAQLEAMAEAIANGGPVTGAPLQAGVPPNESAPPTADAGELY
jgi:hypothetical protein